MCHDAGQRKSTAILLRYGRGDWNALHRDLYGDLVFPLQVVINLNEPGTDELAALLVAPPMPPVLSGPKKASVTFVVPRVGVTSTPTIATLVPIALSSVPST